MNELERDKISERFADLTALLEVAAGLSIGGQSGKRSLALMRSDIAQIWPLLRASEIVLTTIERIIGKDESGRDR